MRTISSPWIGFYKRLFPLLWFGGLILFVVIILGDRVHGPPLVALILPIAMAVVGYYIAKRFIFDLVDEVVDAGDHLIVRSGSTTVTIRFADIINVNYALFQNPQRITLRLAAPSQLGTDIAFMVPRTRWRLLTTTSPLADDLIRRVDAARRAPVPHAP